MSALYFLAGICSACPLTLCYGGGGAEGGRRIWLKWGRFGVTDKQKRFVDVLLDTGDGAAALLEAGYTPPWTVKRVLAVPAVRAYLGGKGAADESEVAAFFFAVMRGEPAADDQLPGLKEQLRAAELLGKHFGMFSDRDKSGGDEVVTFVGDELL